MQKKIDVKIDKVQSLDQVLNDWKYIYSSAEENFFLSHHWISSWLTDTLPEFDIYVCTASVEKCPAGMALFVEKQEKRYGLFNIKQWLLHKTGNPSYDQIWIEHNDFLLDKRSASTVRKAMWQTISKQRPDIDEFIIGLSTQGTLAEHKQGLSRYRPWHYTLSTGWAASLVNYDDFDSYWADRSKSFRRQIKRTTQLLGNKCTVNISTDSKVFRERLDTLAPWHIEQWGAESGFHNPFFLSHWHGICEVTGEEAKQALPSPLFSVQVLINDEPLAICLGFRAADTLYFYLSSQKKMTDNKIKIGLYLHYLAIQWCFENDITCYDFLAGDYRYKRSFSDTQEQFYITHFQKNTLFFKLESTLKKLKAKLR